MTSVIFFICIADCIKVYSAHLSMKIILVDPNLVRTFFDNIFLILIMVPTVENNYFLVRSKLGYLR